MMGILAFVVASFVPKQMNRIQTTIRQKAVVSGTVGLLTAAAVPITLTVT